MSIPNEIDAMTILDPILPELRRGLRAVLDIGYGEVTLHLRNGEIKLISWSCSSKLGALTTTTVCGNVEPDNEM